MNANSASEVIANVHHNRGWGFIFFSSVQLGNTSGTPQAPPVFTETRVVLLTPYR